MTETTMKSFTRSKELQWVEFEVNGEVLKATNVAPAMAILDVSVINDTEDDIKRLRMLMAFLDQVLEPASAARLTELMSSVTAPVTLDQMASVAIWLVEEVYGSGRPTEAPSPSPNGSGSTGPSTTGTASTGASTPAPSTGRVL